ncbi:hypothetical protein ACHAP5_008911 [Fusarium lateritium]
MCFSLPSVVYCLLSTQTCIALARLCKPSPSTTATEASTTTTPSASTGTPLRATLDDGRELSAYLPNPHFGSEHVNSDPENIVEAAAVFGIETTSLHLYAQLPDGSKRYAKTNFLNGSGYGFLFNTAESIESDTYFDFVTCRLTTEDFLDCMSETSETHMYFTYDDPTKGGINKYYVSDRDSVDSRASAVQFRVS